MKRLRLKKIWVFIAIAMVMLPLLSGSAVELLATSEGGSSSSGFSLRFVVKAQDGTIIESDPSGGTSYDEFILRTPENGDAGFSQSLPAKITIMLYSGDEEAVYEAANIYNVTWEVKINGDAVADIGTVTSSIENDYATIMVRPFENGTRVTMLELDIQPKSAGVLFFEFRANLSLQGAAPGGPTLEVPRFAYVKVPLQLYHQIGANSFSKYATLKDDEDSFEILANNAAATKVFWYYYDVGTDQYIKLEDVATINTENAKPNSALVSSIGEGIPEPNITGGRIPIHSYPVNVTSNGGITRIVGRVFYKDEPVSTSTSKQYYVEQVFDVLVQAKARENSVELDYGERRSFKALSNDAGGSLEWYTGDESTMTMPTVVELVQNEGVIGKNWGTEILTLTPVPAFRKWELFNDINIEMYDKIEFITKFAILKGDTEEQRIKAKEVEAIDVNGSVIFSTNAVGSGNSYYWYYIEGGTKVSIQGGNEYVNVEDVANVINTPSAIKLTGIKAGNFTLYCDVTTSDGSKSDTREVIVLVEDSFELDKTREIISVGSSFILTASTTTGVIGNVEWSSSDSTKVSVESQSGNTAAVTGVAVTGADEWITITAKQVLTNRIATCRVRVVGAASAVTIEGDTVIGVDETGNLQLVFEGTDPGYSRNDIEWVLKDKGTDADEILEIRTTADPYKVTIYGKAAGEAYVAVVANNPSKTEIAVTTIKVVTAPESLVLSDENVVGYLQDDPYTLTAAISPAGYTDDDAIEIVWTSSDESVATVESTGKRTAAVTYKNVGRVIITATVRGMSNIADACYFDIQNPATGIDLDKNSMNMKVGDSEYLKATITPDNVTDTSLTWKSSDPSVATVDGSGYVTAVAPGGAVITATTSNGQKDECIVTVLRPAAGIELNYTTMTVKKGTIFYLSAKVTPADAYDQSVTWTSDNEQVATVAQDGTVTTLTTGVAVITATSNDNPELTATCTVTVTQSVTGLTLNAREKTIKVGEQFLLVATVLPSDSENRGVTFTSSDESIATVDENGLITGLKGGTTLIVVKTEERGLMATCTITVQEDITSITLSETETYVGKGLNKQITATILPESATQKKLIWTSSDNSIVIVDSNGNIHGVNLGTAIITATAQDDGKVKATCKVTVINQSTKITLNETTVRLMQEETFQLTYKIEPENSSVQKVTWTTSDVSVAKVDSLGLVTAVGEGECTIRATVDDGSGNYAECRFIVTALVPITSIRVNSTETTMVRGDTRTLSVYTLPYNTTESYRWMSSDTSVATVDSQGNVRAVGAGTCNITAITSRGGLESQCAVTVLGLNASTVTLEQYDSYDLYLDGVANGITWFSRNKRVATVNNRGMVVARRPGTTEVVARINGKLVSCEITVEKMN